MFKSIWLAFLLSANVMYGQNFEVTQESYTVRSDHGHWAKQVTSLDSLPEKIQRTLRVVLTEKLGKDLYEKLTFENGQVVDLDNHFASSIPSSRMIPKYDLIFVLSDTALGIQAYYLNVDLDTYGQVLSMNWPSKKIERYQLAPIQEVEDFALQYRKKNNLSQNSMFVDLEYDKAQDKLYWIITYKDTIKAEAGNSDQILKLHLSSLKIIGQYISPHFTVH